MKSFRCYDFVRPEMRGVSENEPGLQSPERFLNRHDSDQARIRSVTSALKNPVRIARCRTALFLPVRAEFKTTMVLAYCHQAMSGQRDST
jgi:hypothetical protein